MMEAGLQEFDFNTTNLQIIEIHQHLLNVQKGNKEMTEILPRVLLTLHKIQYIAQTKCPDLASLVKEYYSVVVLIFTKLMQNGERQVEKPIVKKADLMKVKQEFQNSKSKTCINNISQPPKSIIDAQYQNVSEQLEYYNAYYSFGHTNLDKYISNQTKIRKEMQEFIKVINGIEEKSQMFFKEILLSHEVKYSDVEVLRGKMMEKEKNRSNLYKQIENKYYFIINYLKNFFKKIESERVQYDKEKEQLIEALFKQHLLKNNVKNYKNNQIRGQSKQTQTQLTFNQLEQFLINYEEKLMNISQNQKEKEAMMDELYHLKIESDNHKIKNDSDSMILEQNAKIINNMQENILQICNYAADMEYSHIDINNKIDEIGTLGLEEYIDQKEFSEFSMDFKVSLFNIFKKIVSKYAKVNEDSKKQRESLGRRGGISEIRLSGTFANFRRASRRIEDVNPFLYIDKEEMNLGGNTSRDSDKKIQSEAESDGKNSPKLKQSKINSINQNEEQSDNDDIINEKIVRRAKRGFVSNILKKPSNIFPAQIFDNEAKSNDIEDNENEKQKEKEKDTAKGQEDQGKVKKKKNTISNIKWKLEESENVLINAMINQKLTSKFQVIQKPIQEMNNEIMNAPQKLKRRLKLKSHDSLESLFPKQDKKIDSRKSIKKQEISLHETEPTPNKFNKRMKSILSKTSSWGFGKKVKNIMTKQAEFNLEKENLEKNKFEEGNGGGNGNGNGKRSRFSQFSVLEGDENMLEARVELQEDINKPRQSAILKRISRMPIDKSRSSKRVIRATKLGFALAEEIAEQVYAEQAQRDNLNNKRFGQDYIGNKQNLARYSTKGGLNNQQFTSQSQHFDPHNPGGNESSPITIIRSQDFNRVYRNNHQKAYSNSNLNPNLNQNDNNILRNKLLQMNIQTPPKKQPTTSIGYFISKVSKQHPNLRGNRAFMNELKLIFDMPNNEFNKSFKNNFNLQSALEMASSVHIKKCGSVFCTHLLRFYQTIKRLAEAKPNKEELVPSIQKINVIEKQE